VDTGGGNGRVIPLQGEVRFSPVLQGERMARPHLFLIRDLLGFVRYFVLGNGARTD